MKAPLLLLAMLPPLLAVSAAAQQKKGKVMLPAMMIGVWGETADSCKGNAGERDDRVEITANGVETFASHYAVRRWERQKDSFSGRAIVSEEGEGKPVPGRYRVALRLLKEGEIEIRLDRSQARTYLKCHDGAQLR